MTKSLSYLLKPFLDGEWKYIAWPEYFPLNDYKTTQNDFVERCKTVAGVSSIWRVGEIGVPGISDLDFVLGLTDGLAKQHAESLSIHNLDKIGSYISFHQPLILSNDLLANLFVWGSVSQPVYLYGKKIEFHNLTPVQSKLMAIVTLNDIFVQSQPRMLLRTLLSRRMNVRGTLCQINALKHTLRIFRDATGLTTEFWDPFLVGFSEFRQQWFTLGNDRIEQLRLYTIQAIVMLFDLMNAFQTALSVQNWADVKQPLSTANFLAMGFKTQFVNNWVPDLSLSKTLSTWKHSKTLLLELPLVFAEPLRSYIDGRGELSIHVRRYLWQPTQLQKDMWHDSISLMAQQHVQVRNDHVDFLLKNNLLWEDANFSSLGMWPSLLTDRSIKGRLRRPYYGIKKWLDVARGSFGNR
jgi:hypothetical protein